MQLRKLKVISIALVLAMGLTACGGNDAPVQSESSETTPPPAVEETPANLLPSADSFAGGDGTESNPYQIATGEQLAYLAELINKDWDSKDYSEEVSYRQGYYILTGDIELNDTSSLASWESQAPKYEWEPIGADANNPFMGHFDGNGHTIKGMYIDNNFTFTGDNVSGKGSCIGLFGYVNAASISNVTLSDSLVLANGHVITAGSVVGRAMRSTVQDCSSAATMKIAMADYLGGIVGESLSFDPGEGEPIELSTITDNTFEGQVIFINTLPEKVAYIGGILGLAEGNISGCINRGTIQVQGETDDYIGGIAGEFKGGNTSLTNCSNEGDISITGNPYLGGICGSIVAASSSVSSSSETEITTVSGCENKGNISITENSSALLDVVGGIAGNISDFGGTYLEVKNCTNSGTISGLGHVGGILGESTTNVIPWVLSGCTNSGTVIGDTYTGGVMGYAGSAQADSYIENCTNEGSVTGKAFTGGVLGGYFSYNVANSEARAPFTMRDCKNTGAVSLNDGSILGVGGIVGSVQLDTVNDIFYLENCENSGTISGTGALRAGGILGGLSVTSAGPGGFCSIKNCNNSGDLIHGNGGLAITSSMASNSAAVAGGTDDKVALIMGGSSIGGVAGYFKQGIMEDCISTGKIFLDDNAKAIFDYADLSNSLADEEENSLVFVGGVCGLYYYEDGSEGYSPDSCYIRNCKYPASIPTGVVFALPDEAGKATVSNVTATN